MVNHPVRLCRAGVAVISSVAAISDRGLPTTRLDSAVMDTTMIDTMEMPSDTM